jgi:hypothetical protein
VLVHEQRMEEAHAAAADARAALARAHQQVRALELVLEERRAQRAEKQHRIELRLADETAAHVHARNSVGRR